MSAHAEHEQHDHVPIYIKIAALLGVITAAEVGILYVALPKSLMYGGLYSLAALKFGLVVAIFMHLKYDNKMLTGIFFSGFTMALATMVAMIALINYQPSKTSVNIKSQAEWVAMNTGNPDNGPAVFKSKGCVACHAISSLEGAVSTVGPKLDGLSERAAQQASSGKAADYIRESIENPNAYVVEGFAAGLMPANLKASMSDDEYKDLVAYLETL